MKGLNFPNGQLSAKTALVTGAGKRVGRAIAEELARAGARLIGHYHSTELPDGLQADLRQPEAAQFLVDETVKKTGRIDILVNSAAGYAKTPLAQLSDEIWREMMALNLDAPMRLMRTAAAAGVTAIVNIVDVGASQPWPNYLAYSHVQGGAPPSVALSGVGAGAEDTRQLHRPGDGGVSRRSGRAPARGAAQKDAAPARGTPEDVARAVRFLVENDYITGVCLPVDGGAGLR